MFASHPLRMFGSELKLHECNHVHLHVHRHIDTRETKVLPALLLGVALQHCINIAPKSQHER